MKPFFLIVLVLLIISCADSNRKRSIQSAPLITSTYRDDADHLLALQAPPERIISMAPALTEVLFAIGAGPNMVARSEACNYPDDALFLPAIDLETEFIPDSLAKWNPDLVLVPDGYYSGELLDQYAKAGLPLFVIRSESLEEVFRSIRLIGEVTGHQENADALADSLIHRAAELRARTENLIHYGSTLLIDSDPLRVAGGQGLFQELIELAGGKNRFEEAPAILYTTTEEELYSMRPEYLFIPSREPQIYQLLINRYPALYDTPAAANNQVFILDPDIIYRPGPRIVEGAREIAQALHSELADM